MQDNPANSEAQEQTNIAPQKYKPKKILYIITVFLVISIPLMLFVWKENNKTNISVAKPKLSIGIPPTPTPTLLPFRELTIPYLRERKYKSNLETLEESYDTKAYTAYITSYDSDGLRVYGLLTRPKTLMPEGGWPAIIFVHGYIPPDQYQTTQQYYNHINYLSNRGFVVFKIDLRGHGDSEGEPDGSYYSPDYIIDVLNAYSAMQNSSFVNPQKIGLWGHSMAGNIVLRSFAAKPQIPGVVIWAGAVYSYSDFQEYGIDDNSYRPPQMSSERIRKTQELFDTHGQFNKESEFWKQVIPTNYLNDLQGAIQIHHAVNDNVVDIRYGRNLNELLNFTSVVHEFHEYSSGGHNIIGESFTQAMEKTVNFYRENL